MLEKIGATIGDLVVVMLIAVVCVAASLLHIRRTGTVSVGHKILGIACLSVLAVCLWLILAG